MNKKKLLLLTVIPLAALLLSACSGQKTAPTKNASDQSAQSAPTETSQVDAQQVQQPQLQPLPADDKQAIDTELDNIDKDLKSTDNTVQSQDLSNANLGL